MWTLDKLTLAGVLGQPKDDRVGLSKVLLQILVLTTSLILPYIKKDRLSWEALVMWASTLRSLSGLCPGYTTVTVRTVMEATHECTPRTAAVLSLHLEGSNGTVTTLTHGTPTTSAPPTN